jgi:hypothetical protein
MRTALVALLSTGIALAAAGHAAASPGEDGCPSAFEPKTLEEWNDLGYLHAPGRVDLAGNNDGTTCGMVLPPGYRWGFFVQARDIETTPAVPYLFVDNDRPPADR